MKQWIRTLAVCSVLLTGWTAPAFADAATHAQPVAAADAAGKTASVQTKALPEKEPAARPASALEEVADALVRQGQAKSQQLKGTLLMDSLIFRIQGDLKVETGTVSPKKPAALTVPDQTAKITMNVTTEDLTRKSKPVRRKFVIYSLLQNDSLTLYKQLPNRSWVRTVKQIKERPQREKFTRAEALKSLASAERAGRDGANRLYRVRLKNLTNLTSAGQESKAEEALSTSLNLSPEEQNRLRTAFDGTPLLLSIDREGYPVAVSADLTKGLHRVFDVLVDHAIQSRKPTLLHAEQGAALVKAVLRTMTLRLDATVGAASKRAPKIPKAALQARLVPADVFQKDAVPER